MRRSRQQPAEAVGQGNRTLLSCRGSRPPIPSHRWLAAAALLAGLATADPAASAQAAATASPAGPATVSATIVAVIDADTLRATLPDGRERLVRLVGVDAPEIEGPHRRAEPGGEAAAALARALIPLGRVALERAEGGDEEDRYGRLLRYVRLADGRDAGAEIIAAGFAEAYRRFAHPRRDSYVALEETARREKRGLWGPGCGR